MSDAFRETNTETYRNIVTFQSGFGVIADEPFTVGSPTTTNSTLVTYNLIKPLGGISGYVHFTGLGNQNVYIPNFISGDSMIINMTDGFFMNLVGDEVLSVNDAQIFGANVNVSIDWQARELWTDAGNNTLSWGVGQLRDDNNIACGNWFSRYLQDGNGIITFDWANRILTGGAWSAQSFSVSGSPVITKTQTGNFVDLTSNQTISGTKLFSGSTQFSKQYYAAQFSGTTSIDWNNGNVQYLQLVTGSQTLNFSNPSGGGRYILMLKQPATSGASGVVSWPTGVSWGGGVAPTLTLTTGKMDMVSFIYDKFNAKYYGNPSLNF